MRITRRSVCAGAAVSAAFAASSTGSAVAMPASPDFRAGPPNRVLAQFAPPGPPPTQDDLRDQETFQSYLMLRFRGRIEKMGFKIDGDADPEIQQFATQAAHASFEEQRSGQINRERDYRVLPVQVRRVIITRNFDTLTDVLIVAAVETKNITHSVILRVRDFICPLYPFC